MPDGEVVTAVCTFAMTPAQFTIHGVPNRTTVIPNRSAQNVLSIGITTWPPSESSGGVS